MELISYLDKKQDAMPHLNRTEPYRTRNLSVIFKKCLKMQGLDQL